MQRTRKEICFANLASLRESFCFSGLGGAFKTEKLQQPNEGPPKLSYLTTGKRKVESTPVFVNCFFAAAEASLNSTLRRFETFARLRQFFTST
ncbi:MAG: hypothetical protein AAB354_02500 [candidate division KSB1 bacterium]